MSQTIEKLYQEEIERHINPAVVVSELEEKQIEQEIGEYIFTPELTRGLYKFLYALVNKEKGKTGIWISGYYGSGKSHFIKFIFYCLHPQYREQAFGKFNDSLRNLDDLEEDVTPANVRAIKSKLDKSDIDTILFNIDAISRNERDTNTITEVFLHKLNEHRGYNNQNVALALYLEKPLDKTGMFQMFKKRIKETFNTDWYGNQQNISFTHLSKVLEIAHDLDESIDVESLKRIINNRRQDYTIDDLVREFQDFLSDKDENYRLLFLVDEVSQYIGSNENLLLNLETIVEETASHCGNHIWLGCTAQQELPEVISNTGNKTGAFGKIMGRFETRISLESMDASDITKRRLLEKNSLGEKVLSEFFNDHQVEIQNQFVTDVELYKNYEDKADFTLTYPFIPFQFQLISDVFQSFSSLDYVDEEVKNTERSIIGITHFTARLCKDRDVGYFVPFDLYLNDSFRERLKNRALNILKRALDLTEKDPFAQRVVKILFMISNLIDSIAVAFPATAENVALLMIDDINDSRSELQEQVEKVLEKLENQNIIQYKNNVYKFFKEDEIEIANRIQNDVKISLDDRWSAFYDHMIKPVLSPSSKYSYGNNVFKATLRIDEKEIIPNGDFDIEFMLMTDQEMPQLAHELPKKALGVGFCEWFKKEKSFQSKLNDFVRTQKFLEANLQGASGQTYKTLKEFEDTNNELLVEIKSVFALKFQSTSIISAQQVFTADAFKSQNPKERLNQMIEKHLSNIYDKNALAQSYADSNQALIKSAQDSQLKLNQDLSPAEMQLESQIKLMGEGCQLSDVVNKFEKQPYGWNPLATLDVLVHLARKGKRQFEYNNEELELKDFADLALNRRERSSITIISKREIDTVKIKRFVEAVNDEIFLKQILKTGGEPKSIVRNFREAMEKYVGKLKSFKINYKEYPFSEHLDSFYELLNELVAKRDTESVIDLMLEKKIELKELRDKYGLVDEFTENQFSQYKKIRNFYQDNEKNFAYLDEEAKQKAAELENFALEDNKPWVRFPQFIKVHKELRKSLNDFIKEKQQDVSAVWEEVFDALEERQAELKLENNILPSREYHLDKIKRMNDIGQLELKRHESVAFKKELLKNLEEEKAKEDEVKGKKYVPSKNIEIAREMAPRTVENEEQLDEYMKELREHLMDKLNKHQKLYLN